MNDELERILAQVASGALTPDEAEPLVAAATSTLPRSVDRADPNAETRAWETLPPTAPRAPAVAQPSGAGADPNPGPTRAVRIQVTDGGRSVVNLRVPMSLASLAGSVIPGLAEPQVARLQQALRNGEIGTILDVRDERGSGVIIATE